MSNSLYDGEKILAELGINSERVKKLERGNPKRSSYRAIFNWLTKYQPNTNASNLEKVKGLLEAFYHLCELKEWDKARLIVSVRLNIPTNEELHRQLGTWKYYKQQINIYKKLLHKIDSNWDDICLEGLKNATRALGEREDSRNDDEQQESISINVNSLDSKINFLIGLANDSKFKSQYQKATNYYLQVLELAFKNSNHQGKMMALAGLGSVLTSLGQYEIALEYHKQQLSIAFDIEKMINNELGKAEALTHLGYIYYLLKDYQEARKLLTQSYKIAIKLEHKEIEAKTLLYKGMISYQQGENKEAINCYKESLELIDQIGLILEKADVLVHLTISQREIEKDNINNLQTNIITQLQQALFIFREYQNSIQEANLLKEIAKTYVFMSDSSTAQEYYQKALGMAIELNLHSLKEECEEFFQSNSQEQFSFKLPEIQEIEEEKCENYKQSIDVLIITVTDVEKGSVLEHLEKYPRRKKVLQIFSESETYYLGKFGAFNTVLTQCRMGSTGQGSAILATEQAIRKWNPKVVIMVGIAFGKDEEKQNIGDVLVAEEIINYEPQRVGEPVIHRGNHPPSNQTILNRFRNVHDWQFSGIDNASCQIRLGAILSGEKLVDNPEFKAQLFQQFPQAIGGEMEGTGLSSACMRKGIAWILVKSICDWADGKKHSKYQPLAAKSAASLVHHVLKQKTVLNGIEKKLIKE